MSDTPDYDDEFPTLDSNALYEAITYGRGDPAALLPDLLDAAMRGLELMSYRLWNRPEEGDFVGDLQAVVFHLAEAMQPTGTDYRLIFRRRPGKPGDRLARHKKLFEAGAKVQFLVWDGVKQESAIHETQQQTGLLRREIMRGLALARSRVGDVSELIEHDEDISALNDED